MALKKILLTAIGLALASAGIAQARTAGLDSLALESPAPPAPSPAMVWAGMEAEVDSVWSELAPEIETQRAYYFAPTGPADRDWASKGVDMAALLAARPGGAAANVLYSDDAEGPVLQAFAGPAASDLEGEWTGLAERRFADGDGTAFVSMLALTSAHLLVSREAWAPAGKGYCPASKQAAPADHMAVYRDPEVPFDSSGEQEGMAFSIWTALSRAAAPRVCWIYVEVAPGVFETRSFDLQGRPLGRMDEGTKRLRIVPLADLRAMLTARLQPQKRQDSAHAQ